MHSEYLHVSRYNFDINLSGVMMKMGNYYLPFSLRISDELLEKLKTIAFYNKRSTNKEMEFALEKYVQEYENEHGELLL